jgi:ribosome biogenesis GTPase / thiamine phosphate phosphatase
VVDKLVNRKGTSFYGSFYTMTIKARIFRSSKRHFDCQCEDSKEQVVATALAALLKEDHLVVGDWVMLTPPPKPGEDWVITEIIPRKNAISRNLPREQRKKVIASNVDVMVVVVSAGRPAYKRGLVDRYLVRSEFWDVPAYVIFNKMDLYDESEFDIKFEADRLGGLNVECFEISAQKGDYAPRFLKNGMEELIKSLASKTTILLGHSGVGKSQLISKLSDGKIQLLSGELGKIGKGSHTTTWAELIDAERFTLIDSPGVRSMSLSDLTKEELLQSFSDIQELACQCKFASNCGHEENSKGCFFQALDQSKREHQLIFSRLDSYKRVLEEVADIPDWLKKN